MANTTADRGYAYSATFGKDVTSGKCKAGWYRVKKTVTASTVIPNKAQKKDVFYLNAEKTLGTGEEVTPIILEKICFLNSLTLNSTREKQDVTTWNDSVKRYIVPGLSEQTGSAAGYFDDASALQSSIFGQFLPVLTQDGSTVSRSEPSGGTVFLMQSIREKDAKSGEWVTWRWLPMVVDSVDANTEGNAAVPFSFNFTVDGGENPMIVKIKQA